MRCGAAVYRRYRAWVARCAVRGCAVPRRVLLLLLMLVLPWPPPMLRPSNVTPCVP